MITPFECYVIYIGLKQHFTNPGYNYFKYHGKITTSYESFETRNDYYYFKRLSEHRYPGNLILANIIEIRPTQPVPWIGQIVSEDGDKKYRSWEKRRQSLTHIIKDKSLDKLDKDFDKNIRIVNYQLPLMLKLQLQKKIVPELAPIACKLLPSIVQYWNSKIGNNPILDAMVHRTIKYMPFVEFDEDKIKSVFLSHFSNEKAINSVDAIEASP